MRRESHAQRKGPVARPTAAALTLLATCVGVLLYSDAWRRKPPWLQVAWPIPVKEAKERIARVRNFLLRGQLRGSGRVSSGQSLCWCVMLYLWVHRWVVVQALGHWLFV